MARQKEPPAAHIRIGIEAGETLRARPAGVARYIVELMRAFDTTSQEFAFEAWYPLKRMLRAHLRARQMPARWLGLSPPARAPELFHAAGWRFPDWRSPVEVVTVHDLYALLEPGLSVEQHQARTAYIRRAGWAICVSEHTRRHLLQAVAFDPARVLTISLGVGARFRPAGAEAVADLRHRYRLPAEYLLFVGQARRNKNLHGLIRAHAASGLDVPLVVAGKQPGGLHDELKALVAKTPARAPVRFLGYVPDDDLPTLMSAAAAFCFPSTFEGFGLPLLEAMACGTPVLTSRGIATEEVAAGHAELADPHDTASLAAGLRRVLDADAASRQAAMRYAHSLSWDNTVDAALAVYRQALAAY